MRGRFYGDVFAAAGITLVTPSPAEQAYLHDKYMTELLRAAILPQTRDALHAIIARLKEQDTIEGAVLGGTELSLILRDAKVQGIPLLDTTKLHVDAIVRQLLS